MFDRLLTILRNESNIMAKQRNLVNPGPISMNIGMRRKTVDTINQGNVMVSKKLESIRCRVPSLIDI